MSLYALPPLVSAILIGIVSFWVYSRNTASKLNLTFTCFCLSLIIWLLGFTGMYASRNDASAIWWARTGFIGVAFIPATMYHFVITFLNLPRKNLIAFLYLVGILAAAISRTDLIYNGVWTNFWGYYPTAGFFYWISPVTFLGCFIGGASLLYSALGQERDAHRQQQIKYVMLAFVCATPGFVDYLGKYRIPLYPLGWLNALLFISWIAYAIVKHQLMDIRVVIRKSLVYSFLVACITTAYLVMVLVMERWCQGFMGYRSFVATVVVAFLIAIFFNPLRSRIQTWVDRALFKATPAELAEQREQLLAEVRQGDQRKAVATLAAGLAHEIKNPLTSIRTFTEYLDARYMDADFRAKFQKIVGGEVERINLIAQRLLEFAKPAPLTLRLTDLSQLLDDTLEFLGNEFVQHQVDVSRSYDSRPHVFADPQQLKQVFLNLFLNSLQAMNGCGRLEVHATVEGSKAVVSIRDDGSGIAPKDLPHVFEPFFTTKPSGTGLGLSVVQGIINEHGGTIHVASQPGSGTTVTLHLPIAT